MAVSRLSPAVLASIPVVNFSAPPEVFNFSKDVIDKWAQFPELKAMIWTSTTDTSRRRDLSFKHFSDYSHRVARWMSEQLGIRKEDRIVIMLPRLPEWWEIILVSLAYNHNVCLMGEC
jgi:medium-chain acyl-CoA synthetase